MKEFAVPEGARDNPATARPAANPSDVPKDRRLNSLACKKCGSRDVWRTGPVIENIFLAFRHRSMKPFQCRACGHRFHSHARRRSDNRLILGGKKVHTKKIPNGLILAGIAASIGVMLIILVRMRWYPLSLGRVAGDSIATGPGKATDWVLGRPRVGAVRIQNRSSFDASAKPLTNDDVIALKAAGFSDSLIIDRTRSSPGAYSLGTAQLIQLKEAGISDAVVSAMLHAKVASDK
jgi:hypothetical protein